MRPQITVLDAGGQYCHLIARKVRDLGVYAEVAASETPASELAGRRGIIISGGPSSVYDPGSPTIDPLLLSSGTPVLGICYGQQLMAHILGGHVRKGDRGEYGFAQLDMARTDGLFRGISGRQQVWMSHRDAVQSPPPGFDVLAQHRDLYGGRHGIARARTLRGAVSSGGRAHALRHANPVELRVRQVCGCVKDWDPAGQVQAVEDQIRR